MYPEGERLARERGLLVRVTTRQEGAYVSL